MDIDRERISPTESFAGLVKALKVVTYVFVFFFTWLSATVGTSCMLILVSQLAHGGTVNSVSWRSSTDFSHVLKT